MLVRKVRQFGDGTQVRGKADVELVWHFGNYFKHRDEGGLRTHTANALTAAGLSDDCSMAQCIAKLGLDPEQLPELAKFVDGWAKKVYLACQNAV